MAAPYRGRSTGNALLIGFLIGLAGAITAVLLLRPREASLGGSVFVIAALPLLVGFTIGAWFEARHGRQRLDRISEALSGYGLKMISQPGEQDKAWLRPYLDLLGPPLGLSTGVDGLEWVGYSPTMLVFQHHYQVRFRQRYESHYHTVVAWSPDSPEPRGVRSGTMEPLLVVRPRVGEERAMRQEVGADVQFGDAAFDKLWCVYGSAATARRFLQDEVRAELLDSPRGEVWYLGQHWVLCAYRGEMDAENLRALVEHGRKILSLAG